MSYKACFFKADQNPELCMEYSRKHTAVLSEYGCAGLKVVKEAWMASPNVYAVVIYNDMDEMVAGVRLHLGMNKAALPIEANVAGMEKVMHIMNSGNNKMTAEICGIWIAKTARFKGFDSVLTCLTTAIANEFGATSLFALASHYTVNMYEELGYVKVSGVGRSGDFMNPGIDYTTVMMVPNLNTMEYATAALKAKMEAVRENPTLTLVESNDVTIECHLDTAITDAPAVVTCMEETYSFAA